MNIVTTIVDALTLFVTGSASAIGTGVSNLLVDSTGSTPVLTVAGTVIFTLFGVGLAVGLMHVILGVFTR